MEHDEIITSPYHGIIKEVIIKEKEKISQWAPLFIIQTLNGENKVISVGIKGRVQSIEVQKGDEVIPGMVLTYVKDDAFIGKY